MIRILFVAAETQVVGGFKRALWRFRREFRVATAINAEQAKGLLDEVEFDVVIVDFGARETEGEAVLAHARGSWPRCVRIALNPPQHVSLLVAHSLAHRLIKKPYVPELLVETVRRCLQPDSFACDPAAVAALSALQTLPSPPQVYRELERVLSEPAVELADIVAVAERDAALSARLLWIANTSWMAPPRPVTSVDLAVRNLGFDAVRGIALMTTFEGSQVEGVSLEEVFEHSLVVAKIAQKLARGNLRPIAFCAAMVHDVGRLALAAAMPAEYRLALNLTREGTMEPTQAEQAALGISHSDAGGFLLELWGVPQPIVQAVREHEALPHLVDELPPLSSVVRAANLLAHLHEGESRPLQAEHRLREIGDDAQLVRWRSVAEQVVLAQRELL